jgi:predicted NBD/HSP70 family sugar kinase/DNA-binding MarR family transcriptional regulator
VFSFVFARKRNALPARGFQARCNAANGGVMVLLMTENERRILGELAKVSPLSKRDITERCKMGWATAVKLMTRLEEQGYLLPFGNERQNQAGKSATVYSLSPTRPVALGIDIEYTRSRWTIRNLSRECLFETERSTPEFLSPDDLVGFLDTLLREASAKAADLGIVLEGAGIGVPSHLFGTRALPYAAIAETLSSRAGLPVTVDNNIRCFSAGIASLGQPQASMLVVTVRSGIGVGIVMDGRVYQGERGCSGEIGHFPVAVDGARCRCGKTGCLETLVNREVLASDLAAARSGDQGAQKRVANAAGLLGKAIATTMLVLDIRTVAVFAELGDLGKTLLEPLRLAAQEGVYPGFDFAMRYETLDAEAYVAGAARLVLDEFVRR